MADLSKAQKDAAYHLGREIARHLAAAALAAMRCDVVLVADVDDEDSPAAGGWRFMDAALAQAWANAQSAEDRAAGAAPLPETGPAPACIRPALHRIYGYTPNATTQYGSLDVSLQACGAHARQYRDRLAAEFGTAFDNGPQPTTDGRPCGFRYDYRTALDPKGPANA